uniref:WAT1-related protein n=1 Tax=Anthurium amnicola TaxID=1678845 RepID=A0A1D1YLG1_9ARAE
MADMKLYLTIILIRTIYAGMNMFAQAAFSGGMDTFVFAFYRQASATIFLTPIAIIFERKRAPQLSFKILCKMFALAGCGLTFCFELYNVSVKYTSATVAAATMNTIPVTTFVLAALLGLESVQLKDMSGITKLLGVAFCLVGAMAIAFYQGPLLKSFNHHHLLGHKTGVTDDHGSFSTTTWAKGCLLMVLGNIGWSIWLVMQGAILKQYPSKLLFTAFQCFFSAIQTFFIALSFERDFTRWKLGLDVRLLSVAYCGIIVTGVSFYLQSWCIERAGPVILAMSTPLTLLITMGSLSFVFGETIPLGSIIGGVLMVGGLYSVIWGRSKEHVHSSRLPMSREDGKEKSQIKQIPSPLNEETKTPNFDSFDSECQRDQKV